jgi:hypothetical protein
MDPRLLDDMFPGTTSDANLVCPKCEREHPGQYGSRCHCNQCGHEWGRYDMLNDIPRCMLETGETVYWNEEIELWVDLKTGNTYEPSEGDDEE